MLKPLIFTVLSLFLIPGQADTQITINDIRGGVSKMTSDGKRARLDDQDDPTYSIADFRSGEFFVVDPNRKQVMRMNMDEMATSFGDTGAAAPLNIKLKKKSKGPKIAKYKTRKYDLSANGKHCATFFGSKKLLKKKGVSELFEFMSQMRKQTMKMAGAFSGNIDICERAIQEASLSFKKIGAPMRILDANGSIETEVTKVKTKKKVDSAYYKLPSDYEVVSMADQIESANQQSQQMIEQMGEDMPDMDALMEQLQGQNGEIPDEIQDQLKQMQEMLKQYQQQ